MTVVELLLLLLIAGVCGNLAQGIAGYSHGGCLVAIALGFIGALLGSWMARGLHLPEPLMVKLGDQEFPVVWSIIGAALFSAIFERFHAPAARRYVAVLPAIAPSWHQRSGASDRNSLAAFPLPTKVNVSSEERRNGQRQRRKHRRLAQR